MRRVGQPTHASEREVEFRLVRDQRALVGRERHCDARHVDARAAERGREQLLVGAVLQERREVARHVGCERERTQRREFARCFFPRAAKVRHLARIDRRVARLLLERCEFWQQQLLGLRMMERRARAAVPHQFGFVGRVDDRQGATTRHLRAEAKHLARLAVAVLCMARDAGGTASVICRSHRAVRAGMHRLRGARIATAVVGPMARAARNGARRRQLLVPEQRFAEQRALERRRVLRRRRGRGHVGRLMRRECLRQHACRRQREQRNTERNAADHCEVTRAGRGRAMGESRLRGGNIADARSRLQWRIARCQGHFRACGKPLRSAISPRRNAISALRHWQCHDAVNSHHIANPA